MATKKSVVKKRRGRPLLSREKVGYETDLQNVARLRTATMCDKRVPMVSYEKISDAIRVIERELRKLSKV